MLAFPFPLGYGAISKIQETGKPQTEEATDCPNSETPGLLTHCIMRRKQLLEIASWSEAAPVRAA
jgi:hypothetical protein